MQGKTVASPSETNETPAKVLIIPETEENELLVRLILNRHRNAAVSVEPLQWPVPTAALAAAEQDPTDLIILFILNPHFISDAECHRFRTSRARPALRDIPILFISVHKGQSGSVDEHARRFGANGYVEIPCRPEEILDAYDTVLGGKTYPPLFDES